MEGRRGGRGRGHWRGRGGQPKQSGSQSDRAGSSEGTRPGMDEGGNYQQRGRSWRERGESRPHYSGEREDTGSRGAVGRQHFEREEHEVREWSETGKRRGTGKQIRGSGEGRFHRRGSYADSRLGSDTQGPSTSDSQKNWKTETLEQSSPSSSKYHSEKQEDGRRRREDKKYSQPPKKDSSVDIRSSSLGGESHTKEHKKTHPVPEESAEKSLKSVPWGRESFSQKLTGKSTAAPHVQERTQMVSEKCTVEAKLLPSSKQMTVSQKEGAEDIGFVLPRRKGSGKKGRPVQIEVNHFLLALTKPSATAVHYDVTFVPKASRRLCRAAVDVLRQTKYPTRYAAFDGKKNLYSCGKLPFGDSVTATVDVYDEENCRDITFTVTLNVASEVNMSKLMTYGKNGQQELPQDAIQALDIVLRNPATQSFLSVGRNFFSPQQNIITELGDGLHLWYGFSQSAILAWKPFLNIDVAHKAFKAPGTLIEIIENFGCNKSQPLSKEAVRNLEDYLKEIKVEYEVPGVPNSKRTFKFVRVKGRCDGERFDRGNGVMMTVGEYFEKEKSYRLRYPHLPCIHLGNENRTNYIPIEICSIPSGQSIEGKLNERQTAQMVRNAAQPPYKRKDQIMRSVHSVSFSTDPCINEFGIRVSDKFQKLNARILDSPELQYRRQGSVKPQLGVWRGEQFWKVCEHLERMWIILNLDKYARMDTLRNLEDLMRQAGNDFGVNMGPCDHQSLELRGNDERAKQDIISYLRGVKKENKAKLVVVVIPSYPSGRGIDVYGVVKSAAELAVGVLTQCIKSLTLGPKLNRTVAGNLLLKVNSKLNGINYTLSASCLPSVMKEPVMIVGADVTHPPKGDTSPSIAAVAASHNVEAFSYNMIWRIQKPRQEIIEDLTEIMCQQLLFFYQKTGVHPRKILFYRDGVSDQQFLKVMGTELRAIRQACKKMGSGEGYEPGITFLIVQKRHHTRFFPVTNDKLKNGNVLPGTVVDTEITHPLESNFYLVSHASIQGTSRPTKYHKLWDDNDISEDDLQELTYYLCHLFARCTRSVSYPAPTYYAHLAAFRAKSYLGRSIIDVTDLKKEQEKRTIQPTFFDQVPMFFV